MNTISQLQDIYAKEQKHEEEKDHGLSKPEIIKESTLTAQLNASTVEFLLTARRMQDLEALNQFVQIAQKEFAGKTTALSQKDIDYYVNLMKNENPFPEGYDSEKAHTLFIEYFTKEVLDNKILETDENLESCNLDKSLAYLILEMARQLPKDNGSSVMSEIQDLANKYSTPANQQIDETKLGVSDKNKLDELVKQMNDINRKNGVYY